MPSVESRKCQSTSGLKPLGISFTAGAPLGTNPGAPANPPSPRGSHTMTQLWDGSHLLLGGFHSPDTTTILVKDDGFIYTR